MPTRVPLRSLCVFMVICGLTACASAGKRLEQGLEAEASGAYYEATMRYLEAVEKDRSLGEARQRAAAAGDSAIARGMAAAEERAARGEALEAAAEYSALDRLVRRGREVDVRLSTPEDYRDRRRGAFDAAIDDLMQSGNDAGARAQWGEARSSYQRIRQDFDPSVAQREASEEAEAWSLLDWAASEESDGRFRRAYDLAAEALEMPSSPPADLVDQAAAIQDRGLLSGLHTIAVFPVTATAPVRERMEGDLDQQLADHLELEYWRAPPLFVVVEDPVVVRQVTRRLTPPGMPLRPAPILSDLGADFGVLVELVGLEREERDLRHEVREARTKDGRTTNYSVESGTVRYRLEASVVLLDVRGREVGDFRVNATEDGRFERGIYRADVAELDLGRSERRLFDPLAQRRRLSDVEAQLVAELAGRLGDQVYSRVLSRIP